MPFSRGHAKFETDKDGAFKEFVVESVTSSIAELEQTGTVAEVLKHVGMLKVLSNTLPADTAEDPGPSPLSKKQMASLAPVGPFLRAAAKTDGSCLFPPVTMGMQSLQARRPIGCPIVTSKLCS